MPDREFPRPGVRHASPAVAALLTSYHRGKWDHDLDTWLADFAADGCYGDATLGWFRRDRAELRAGLEQAVPRWGDGRSWASRIVGGDSGAIVAVVDEAPLFGSEIRALSLVGVRDGEVVRFVDHWDSRAFGTARADALRAADYPGELLTPDPRIVPDPAVDVVCRELQDALAADDPAAVAERIASDVVWEDRTLRLQLVGRDVVQRYLARSGGQLPYARGATVLDVVGGPLGGGWSWRTAHHPVRTGVVAVELTAAGIVGRFTTVWDGGRLTADQLTAMSAWAVEAPR